MSTEFYCPETFSILHSTDNSFYFSYGRDSIIYDEFCGLYLYLEGSWLKKQHLNSYMELVSSNKVLT